MKKDKEKNILLGITGSIAAYKANELVRMFIKGGFKVHVILTANAKHFVSETVLRALSRNPVLYDMFTPVDSWKTKHITLADIADAFVIAPCTANVIAKLACGIADDLLSTIALSVRCPIFIAPAMNVNMWVNPATQNNINILKSRGVIIFPPETGELACGIEGPGRLCDVKKIFNGVLEYLKKHRRNR